MTSPTPWQEKHFSATEVAELFGLSAETVRGIHKRIAAKIAPESEGQAW